MEENKGKGSGEEKIIVTSALPYVNNIPHLGNLVCVVSADVYTRYLKSKGKKVISILGTDEHGTTTEIRAMQEGLTPKEITDKYFKIHKRIYDFFLCEPDCFGRTSSEKNKEITIHLFKKLDENGYISEGELEQFYCPHCDRMLADRFVVGKCKVCGYENAKGDQCEKCGSLLEPDQLENPRCAICGGKVELIKSKHLFLDLPALSEELKEFFEEKKNHWTHNAVSMTESWFEQGLRKRCISRDLEWGIPIPKKGYEDKVFYSWFDAPIGYIGITAEKIEDWKEWWLDDSTRLVQFMGKDNIPFHTILFPAILIGSREGYTLVDTLSANEYLNYEGGKFSKSEERGVFGDDAEKLGIRPDVWRYYLIINRPEKSDTDFSWEDFREKLNNELVGNFGNLIYRILVFLRNYYNSRIPKGILEKEDELFILELKRHVNKVEELFEKIQLKSALKEIMKIARLGNQYMQQNKPWDKGVSSKRRATTLYLLANLAKDLAILIKPVMPGVSKDIFNQLRIKEQKWDALFDMSLKEGHEVGKPFPLFKKISYEEMMEYKRRFSREASNHIKKKRGEKGKKDKIAAVEMKDENNSENRREVEFKDLDLRVGVIQEVKEHPNADRLWILKVNLGNEERQLVAGLRKEYSADELKGKSIVVVANLKPAKLRGVESQGMLLAAESKSSDDENKGNKKANEKARVGLLLSDAPPGSKIALEGEQENMREDMNTRENIQKETKIREKRRMISVDELFRSFRMEVKQGFAYFNGKRLMAGGKPIRSERVLDGITR